MKKQTNIPQLRFPEFKDSWVNYKFSEIAEFSKGKGISKADIVEDGAIECIRYGELYTTYGETINDVKSKTNISEDDLVFSEANDVIIPASGETQLDIATASCVLKSGIALGGDLNIIKTKNNGVFLSYYLNNKKKLDIASLAQGISVVHLYASQLSQLELNLPSIPEQNKISNFISSIDVRLKTLIQKKNILEQFKKSVMQKIFSQELRFKDENGKDFPKWENKLLRNLVEFRNGKAHEQDISEDGKYIVVNSKFISRDGEVKKYSDTQICPLEFREIVMVMSDIPNGKALAKCFFIDADNKYTLNQRICALKAINVEAKFLIYILNRNKYYLMFNSGVGQTNLTKDEVLDCPLFIPQAREEQIKIAELFLAIDKKINLTQNQIEKSEQYKKGLLQKMFC